MSVEPSVAQSCIEPVSGWGWYGDLLEEKGLKVHLVNPYQSKLIANSKLKNDGEPYNTELKSLVLFWKEFTLHISERDRQCVELLEEKRELQILSSIPGIGAITALTMLAEIGDYNRFSSPEKLVSLAGLVSFSYSSGGTIRFGHITHRGSVWLRTALVESTGKVSRKWGHLHDFYIRLRERKGNKIARVALARKMLVFLGI